MHDQPIQLDTGFDHMPRLSVSSWLHTIDSRVVSGEPIVIIDDGTTQRVVTAPCTGRIVDIYTEVGAQLLPRTVLGMVRPDLIMPEPKHGLGSIILGVLMIGLAVIAIPIVTNVSSVSMPSLPTIPALTERDPVQPTAPEPNPADDPVIDSPMPDAPAPGSSPSDDITNPDALPPEEQTDPNVIEGMPDTSEDPNQFLEPTPEDPNANVTDPNTDVTDPNTDVTDPNQSVDDGSSDTQTTPDTTDNPDEQPVAGFSSNIEITERFWFDVDRIITLTQEVERNLPTGVMSQQEYDDVVASASNEVTQLVDRLSQIITNNRDNTDINAENRRWFSSFTDAKDDCLTVYASIRQAVQSQQPLPNLTSSFTGCYVLADNFQ